MPSFDVVSEIDKPELANAINQTNRELATRFDFKGTDARVEQVENQIIMFADNEFQIKQAVDVLCNKLSKRGVDLACLEYRKIEEIGGGKARQIIGLKEGISSELGRKLVKQIKDEKIKVQTAIQGDQLRISGKKRDDLQNVIAFLKQSDLGIPVQFNNFRD
ncbi:MAG: YajQ family cyclic di-GMP-binding protein [Acidiferrobacterales bacterium]|nr:YajQ family cyclic di-GMP-binding protein [Acidiferrobacterales bacterium]